MRYADDVLDAMQSEPGWLTIGQVAEVSGLSVHRARDTVYGLYTRRMLERRPVPPHRRHHWAGNSQWEYRPA